ncbi:MAG: OmpA family protein, partial [Rhodospirillales bacterium]|nr:OmpA family protein [Rhodospirillales bacterium]
MANQQATIVVKKIKKGGHAAHGGAWKIAYADFVTAMMAFFLLLWLLNSVTQEALEGISNYFAPVFVSEATSGAGGVLGGQSLSVDGAGTSSSGQITQTLELKTPSAGGGADDGEATSDSEAKVITEDIARQAVEMVEQAQFEDAQKAITEAIEASEELEQIKDSIQIENTPDGLRIQIVDMENFAMFPSGSSNMYEDTRKLIRLVSQIILTMTQKLAITGHTDSVPFQTNNGYGNWELSSDRANSARRELLFNQVPEERFSHVVGKAATEPYLIEDTTHASNRRLSIVLLKGTGEIVLEPEVEEVEPEQAPELELNESNTATGLKKPEEIEEEPALEKELTVIQDSGNIISNTLPEEEEEEVE